MKEKWFPEVHHHCPGVPCLIVGTQVDLRDDPQVLEKLARSKQRPILPEMGERLARELGAVKYVECSALTQKGLKNVFDEVSVRSPPQPCLANACSAGHRRRAGATRGEEEGAEMCHPLSCCSARPRVFTVFLTSNIMPTSCSISSTATLAYIFLLYRQPPIALFCLSYRQILNLYLRNQAYY